MPVCAWGEASGRAGRMAEQPVEAGWSVAFLACLLVCPVVFHVESGLSSGLDETVDEPAHCVEVHDMVGSSHDSEDGVRATLRALCPDGFPATGMAAANRPGQLSSRDHVPVPPIELPRT